MKNGYVMMELSRELVLGEMLARQSRNIPNDLAFVSRDKKLSYNLFNERINRLANFLKDNGIKKGNKLAILLYNGNEILEAIFAACKIGAVAVPVNYRLVGAEIEYILKNSDASALIYDSKFVPTVKKFKNNIKKLHIYISVGSDDGLDPEYEGVLIDSSAEEPLVMVKDSDPAFIMYTSGTTGRPKGAVLTHKNQLSKAITFSWELGLKDKENFFCISPLFHQGPMGLSMMFFWLGGYVVVMKKFNPEEAAKTIEKEKPNVLLLVPTMWRSMLQEKNVSNYDLSSLRVGITAGAVSSVGLKKQIAKIYPEIALFDCFGQTETCGTFTVLKPEYAFLKPDSVGKPIVNAEVKIVDEKDKDVAVGEVGEIVCRGQAVLMEYYKDSEATQEAIKNGWFHSGDLARMDEEGFIYLVDRKKDMIISGGENVYSAEVEEVLRNHPKIVEAAVVGLPSEEFGESVHAVIVSKEGIEISQNEVADYCARYLAGYKKPRSMEVIDSLPRNASGKVLKTVLRDKYI